MSCLGRTPSSRCPGVGIASNLVNGIKLTLLKVLSFLLFSSRISNNRLLQHTSCLPLHTSPNTLLSLLLLSSFQSWLPSLVPLNRSMLTSVLDLLHFLWLVFFYCCDFIAVAATKGMTDAAAGEILYTIGNTGISGGD